MTGRNRCMRLLVPVAIAVIFAVGCEAENPVPQRGSSVEAECRREAARVLREPVDAPDNWLKLFGPLLESVLKDGGVQPLWCGSRTDEVYRAVLVPALGTATIIATVNADGAARQSSATIFVDPRTSGQNRANKFRQVASRTEQSFDDHAWRTVEQARDAAAFWTAAAWRSQPDTMDGYVWIIEARRRGNYRMVIRDNFRDRPFERFVLQILKTAGVPTNQDTVGDYAEQ